MIAPANQRSPLQMPVARLPQHFVLIGFLLFGCLGLLTPARSLANQVGVLEENSTTEVDGSEVSGGEEVGGEVSLPTGPDPALSVELARGGKYPWFDSQSGEARSVELTPTRQPDGPIIWQWWDRWFRWNRNSSGTSRWTWSWGNGFARFLEVMAWVLLAALVVYFLWLMRVNIARRFGLAPALASGTDDDGLDQVRIENLPVNLDPSKTDLLSRVRQLLEAGQLESAMIYFFSYQLVTLDKAQRLRLEKGKTNRQYLRELSGSGELQSIVGEATRAFEDVFFGKHNMPRDRFERIWGRLTRFQELARPAQPAPIDGEAA